MDTIEKKLKAVRHEAWMRVEADREALAKMQAKICELERGSICVPPQLPARVTAVMQREAATEQAVLDRSVYRSKSRRVEAPRYCRSRLPET